MGAGDPREERVRVRAHRVSLGHLLHERARAVLPPKRMGVAPAGKGIEVSDLSQPHCRPTVPPQSWPPLQIRVVPRGVQRSSCLRHLCLQLLEGVGVRPQDWGRRHPGEGALGVAAAPGLEGCRDVSGSRYLQDSALLLKAGPGLLRPLRALG